MHIITGWEVLRRSLHLFAWEIWNQQFYVFHHLNIGSDSSLLRKVPPWAIGACVSNDDYKICSFSLIFLCIPTSYPTWPMNDRLNPNQLPLLRLYGVEKLQRRQICRHFPGTLRAHKDAPCNYGMHTSMVSVGYCWPWAWHMCDRPRGLPDLENDFSLIRRRGTCRLRITRTMWKTK